MSMVLAHTFTGRKKLVENLKNVRKKETEKKKSQEEGKLHGRKLEKIRK